MLSDLVSYVDVRTALLRPLTDAEMEFVPDLCMQASSKLRTAQPAIDTRLAAYAADPAAPSGVSPETVASMLAGVIKRVITNPTGAWSRTQSTGPYSESETYAGNRGGNGAGEAPGGLVITTSDLAQLAPMRAGYVPGTIRTRITGWC